MIELNLLPDVKLEYLRAQRSRRVVTVASVLVACGSLLLMLSLLSVNQIQKKHLSDLSKDIDSSSRKLQAQPEISKILTVQNQLQSMDGLHDAKPAASRLFDYLYQVTPASITISGVNTDFTTNTMTINGGADALSTVNKYVDTLKFTEYTVDKGEKTKAFSSVVLSSFSSDATYSITLTYDPTIFDTTKTVKLVVPEIVTTRPHLEHPSDLFTGAPKKTETGGSN